MKTDKVTIHTLREKKRAGEKIAMLTCYDASFARLLDDAGTDILLVGDSVGMVVQGHGTTLPVSLEDMIYHTRAVVRGTRRAQVVGDMPFMSYQASGDEAFRNAGRFLKEGGATGVKLEGAGPVVELTAHLVGSGIPVMGHLGLTPQSVNQFGGFKVQGRDEQAAERIVTDARELADAGAFSVVLECVPEALGRRVTEAVDVPTIGIGAGPHTDAQVLVFHDLVGLSAGRLPRFVKQYADLRSAIGDAVKAFSAEVAAGDYPGPEHTYE